MTNQHPLTNEKALSLFSFERIMDMSQPLETEDFMRTAADWQLEQVIEWLRHNLGSVPLDPVVYSGHEIDVDYVIEDLREAMRPTTTEDNS